MLDKIAGVYLHRRNDTNKIFYVGCTSDVNGKRPHRVEAAVALGLHTANIIKVLKGKRKTTGGFKFTYITNQLNQ